VATCNSTNFFIVRKVGEAFNCTEFRHMLHQSGR
jgi:hypothetical protein